jgi:ABC-2 type transport system permease protein
MRTAALAWSQFRFERRNFWRNPSAAFFNFMLPLIFLVLIATVYGAKDSDLDILVPGLAGLAVMSTTFTALAFNMTFLREQGILKRVRGTPQPPLSFFGGMIASAVMNAFVQVGVIVVIGKLLYDVGWPADWLALVVFTVLGVVAFASLGIAFSHLIPNYDSADAYVNAVFLPVIFISGVFYSTDSMPGVLDGIAQALPLTHVIDGMRGAIVTGSGLGGNETALAVIAVWALFGVLSSVRFFRWE